jgi:FkbM family methyltransferase
MSLIVRCAERLARFSYLIAHPRLIGPRMRGALVSTIVALDQPWLRELDPKTILDIGANTGQFAVAINAIFPDTRILSFEPLPDCFEQLKRNMAKAKNFAAFNYGLGDKAGELPFERNAFSMSSSFLKMTRTHVDAFPFTSRSSTVQVQVERLDEVAPSLNIVEPFLAKIDVQGYEDRVLHGGQQTLRRAAAMLVEMSFEELYEHQPLFDSVCQQVQELGFTYQGNLEQMNCPKTGRVLQVNGIFMRKRR